MDLFKFPDNCILSSMHDTIILFSLKENNVGQCIYLKVSENKFLFPDSFPIEGKEHVVCKLNKSIYGLV
jgi:hypothetical protein